LGGKNETVKRKSQASRFLEDVHQACAIRALRKAERDGFPITSSGDMNAGKRGAKAAATAALTGLTPGETDIRIYLDGGKLISVELKTEKGRLSTEQKDRHELLRGLGFEVHVVKNEHPLDTAIEVMEIACAAGGGDQAKFKTWAVLAAQEVLSAIGKR